MTNKITKKENFKMLMELAMENEREDLATFCQREIDLIEKKASNKKVDTAMIALMELVYTELCNQEKPVTVSELQKSSSVISVELYSNQRITAMLKKLLAENRVEKITEKGKSYYKAV